MKIVQFMAAKRYVGAERSFVELCNELSKSEDVTALVVRGCEFKDRFSDRVEVIELAANPSRYNPFLYTELKKILQKISPDILHVHSAKAAEIAYKLSKLYSIPYIATKRNSERDSKKNIYFDKAPFAVGVSREVTETINNPNKTTIYNGIEPVRVVGKKERVFTIVAAGVLQPRKGFDDLIEQVAQLNFDFRLKIAGEGEQREELERLIGRLGLRGRVELLGQRDDLPKILASAHLQVINSSREGLSRVLIEGLFYSDLIISTKVAGSTEILSDDFLFDRGEAGAKIAHIYHNYGKYRQRFLPIKAKRHFFTLERVAKEYRELYKRVAGV